MDVQPSYWIRYRYRSRDYEYINGLDLKPGRVVRQFGSIALQTELFSVLSPKELALLLQAHDESAPLSVYRTLADVALQQCQAATDLNDPETNQFAAVADMADVMGFYAREHERKRRGVPYGDSFRAPSTKNEEIYRELVPPIELMLQAEEAGGLAPRN